MPSVAEPHHGGLPGLAHEMNRRTAAVALFTAVSLLAAGASRAQPKPSPSSSDAARPKASPSGNTGSPSDQGDSSAKARQRFLDGVAAGKKGDWPKAYEAFLDAWKLKQHPQVALNLGRAELEIGRYGEAVRHFQHCIENSAPADPDVALARDWLAEAQKKAAKLLIVVDVAGARVLVDGVFVGYSPLLSPVSADPGSHIVVAHLAGQRVQRGVVAAAGFASVVDLRIPQQKPAPEPAPSPLAGPSGAPWVVGGLGVTITGFLIGIAASLRRKGQRRPGSASPVSGLDEGESPEGIFGVATGAIGIFGPKDADPNAAKPTAGVRLTPIVSTAGAGLLLGANGEEHRAKGPLSSAAVAAGAGLFAAFAFAVVDGAG